MPLENPNLRREPSFPRGPKAEMSERTWKRVRLQSLRITKPWLSVAEMAEKCELSEKEVYWWLRK